MFPQGSSSCSLMFPQGSSGITRLLLSLTLRFMCLHLIQKLWTLRVQILTRLLRFYHSGQDTFTNTEELISSKNDQLINELHSGTYCCVGLLSLEDEEIICRFINMLVVFSQQTLQVTQIDMWLFVLLLIV